MEKMVTGFLVPRVDIGSILSKHSSQISHSSLKCSVDTPPPATAGRLLKFATSACLATALLTLPPNIQGAPYAQGFLHALQALAQSQSAAGSVSTSQHIYDAARMIPAGEKNTLESELSS